VRGFVQAFVRPHGLDVAAAPRFVDLVERIGAAGRREPQATPVAVYVGRALATPIAFAVMVIGIERDRWWSWLLQATRPPRLVWRAVSNATERRLRAVRRGARLGVRGVTSLGPAGLRAMRQLRRRLWRGSQTAARRLMGGAPGGD
jgi:hypothetical protein